MVSLRESVEDWLLTSLMTHEEHPRYSEVELRVKPVIRKVASNYSIPIFDSEDLELFYKMKINKMLIDSKIKPDDPYYFYYRVLNNLNNDIQRKIKTYKKYGMSEDSIHFCIKYELE
jgi:hypothetical protein